ncbi:MAG: hypothetical protein J0H31_20660 [Alphaproteobacteria bacterium]|nr:hypothetical protein [Alphaproteobacteria bacterium]
MSTEDIPLWVAVFCLGFIAGAAIYFDLASFRRSKRLSADHDFGCHPRPHQPKPGN